MKDSKLFWLNNEGYLDGVPVSRNKFITRLWEEAEKGSNGLIPIYTTFEEEQALADYDIDLPDFEFGFKDGSVIALDGDCYWLVDDSESLNNAEECVKQAIQFIQLNKIAEGINKTSTCLLYTSPSPRDS